MRLTCNDRRGGWRKWEVELYLRGGGRGGWCNDGGGRRLLSLPVGLLLMSNLPYC
ncbi:unnamed protein product [Tuber melanosporum]|uniref:(Perigord truffle) hypothetical protein n=1 Tax=Tuber melanosporum (strain Mel28) TaxID=656061 RepID=D5GFU1_TUBMM|nr:uncharacterized protein GSTUM_00007079001 [Tuber melanosporum]CAZ83384.1 unnamed protein product [Tuber melanosporum]